ncbi:MAG TPA: hypothetical protein VLA37_13490 [Sphingomonadaceae bacterium]|nr:hypothetical protein [Sphingomonadaceae bacterium]
MRSQLTPIPGYESAQAELADDLGWNDMGEGHTADVLPIKPANEDFGGHRDPQTGMQARVARPGQSRKSALDRGHRAAFTLRLDSQRHLKLRLACTIRNSSAQQLVTEALDQLLGEIDGLEALASQVKRD